MSMPRTSRSASAPALAILLLSGCPKPSFKTTTPLVQSKPSTVSDGVWEDYRNVLQNCYDMSASIKQYREDIDQYTRRSTLFGGIVAAVGVGSTAVSTAVAQYQADEPATQKSALVGGVISGTIGLAGTIATLLPQGQVQQHGKAQGAIEGIDEAVWDAVAGVEAIRTGENGDATMVQVTNRLQLKCRDNGQDVLGNRKVVEHVPAELKQLQERLESTEARLNGAQEALDGVIEKGKSKPPKKESKDLGQVPHTVPDDGGLPAEEDGVGASGSGEDEHGGDVDAAAKEPATVEIEPLSLAPRLRSGPR